MVSIQIVLIIGCAYRSFTYIWCMWKYLGLYMMFRCNHFNLPLLYILVILLRIFENSKLYLLRTKTGEE